MSATLHPHRTRIESVHIQGFRSLADVELDGLGQTVVLIGANGSGKSNLIRFFEMLSWMLRARRLAEFIERQGGADDQLFGGRKATPIIQAELRLRTDQGRNDYRFTLAHAHPDRFFFTEEAFRFSRDGFQETASWQHLDSGHREAAIVEAAQASDSQAVHPVTARVIVGLLRSCAEFTAEDGEILALFASRAATAVTAA